MDLKRRSVRQLAGRKRSIYFEPDTDDDLVRPSSDIDVDAEAETARPQPKKRMTRNKPQTRSSRAAKSNESKRQRRKKHRPPVLSPAGQKQGKKVETFQGPSDGKVPDWTSLPLEILREIFIYAAWMSPSGYATSTVDAHWLMRVARTCRAFALPALEAYYLAPSIRNTSQPHRLLGLLQRRKDEIYMDYQVKVRRLYIDVQQLAYTAHGKPLFDLSALIQVLPQLQHLEIAHPAYEPPFRLIKFQKWMYPPDLFSAFEDGGQRLKTWRWNRDMISMSTVHRMYNWMTTTHKSRTFEYTERLVVCGFNASNDQLPPSSDDDSIPPPPDLASAVAALPRVKDLTFISCDLIMDDFLLRIPKNLERLELSNCLEITSDMLLTYFMEGGAHLRELVLHFNPALNLAFLPSLKRLCPRLEVLKMDFTYHSERDNTNDAWALYDQLLTAEEVPTWPSSLREIELLHLQKWSAEGGRNMFSSLIYSAESLQNLRRLVILAHIDIPWRDRASFREHWIDSLRRVFLRRRKAPSEHLGSIKQFRLWESAQEYRQAKSADAVDGQRSGRRQSGLSHIRITPRKNSPEPDTILYPEPALDSAGRAPRRSNRIVRARSQAQSMTSRTSEESEDNEDDVDESVETIEDDLFIQGLCDIVDIRIDNQRPRENQLTEANFLDSEPSGDEDWVEGAELGGDDGDRHAW